MRCEAGCTERLARQAQEEAERELARRGMSSAIAGAWEAFVSGARTDVLVATAHGPSSAAVLGRCGVWVVVRRVDGGVSVTHGPTGYRALRDQRDVDAMDLARHLGSFLGDVHVDADGRISRDGHRAILDWEARR